MLRRVEHESTADSGGGGWRRRGSASGDPAASITAVAHCFFHQRFLLLFLPLHCSRSAVPQAEHCPRGGVQGSSTATCTDCWLRDADWQEQREGHAEVRPRPARQMHVHSARLDRHTVCRVLALALHVIMQLRGNRCEAAWLLLQPRLRGQSAAALRGGRAAAAAAGESAAPASLPASGEMSGTLVRRAKAEEAG